MATKKIPQKLTDDPSQRLDCKIIEMVFIRFHLKKNSKQSWEIGPQTKTQGKVTQIHRPAQHEGEAHFECQHYSGAGKRGRGFSPAAGAGDD